MTQAAPRTEREVEFRACCGKLRWALLDAVGSLPAGVRVATLRWGPAEIPVDVEVDAEQAALAVDAILAAAQRQLGAGAFCYSGRGVLVIGDGQPAAGPSRYGVPLARPGGDAAMRMTVSRRVAGEAKCAATYVKLVEDLGRYDGPVIPAGGSRIVAAGFLDYRMVPLNLDIPPAGDQWHAELTAAQLRDALRDGLGVDPRMLSRRLAVLVEAAGDGEETVASLRECGYTVTMDGGQVTS
jgi:hypothetical protein